MQIFDILQQFYIVLQKNSPNKFSMDQPKVHTFEVFFEWFALLRIAPYMQVLAMRIQRFESEMKNDI